MASPASRDVSSTSTPAAIGRSNVLDLRWTPIVAGAIVAASVSFVLLAFGSGIGLAVASPSATWRDTSSLLAVLAGLWLLLTSLASFALGGYLAGAFRPTVTATAAEVEFRDGIHGVIVWGLAVLIGAALALALPKASAPRSGGAVPTASNGESFLASELDRLLRSDQKPGAAEANDSELRAQAARIIFSGLGRTEITPDDRSYLVRAVMMRAGLTQPEAEARVDKTFGDSKTAVSRARRGAVILAFMIGASLLVGAVVAWLAAAAGGKQRDGSITPEFWHRWEVNRLFVIR
jgi:hypothetical protein